MNIFWISIAISATLAPASPAPVGASTVRADGGQEAGAPQAPEAPKQLAPGGNRKKAGDLPGQAPRGFTPEEAQGWQRALREPDLDLRLALYLELVDRISGDPLVEELVGEWALDLDRPDLAWTARLALREAQALRTRNRRSGRRQNSLFAGLGIHVNGTPLVLHPGSVGTPKSGDPSGYFGARTLTLKTGPNGVRVERRSRADGGEQALVFEAESLEQLLEQHPELARDLGAVRLVPDPGSSELGPVFGALSGQMQFTVDALWSGDAGLLRTDILGIQTAEEPLAGGHPIDGEPIAGLLVERIVPETIASVIALRRGDRLLELNDVPLHCGDDLTRVIKEREAGAALVVKLQREGVLHTFTWKPSIAETPEPQPAPEVDPPVPGTASGDDD